MSSYKQWAASAAKNGPARITWVCGAERLLVHEVCGAVANAIGADDSEIWNAAGDREKDIWAAALSIPAIGYSRLVMIRECGRLKNWRQLNDWLAARSVMQGCYLLFQAEEHDFPRDEDGKLDVPASWLRDSTLGQLVRCSPLTPEDAVEWARRQLPSLTEPQARGLLLRAAGNLAEVRAVVAKARLFGGQISDEALSMLCEELPGDFADKLILGDRKGAMLAAESMSAEALGMTLGLLASRLIVLATLHRAVLDNVSRRDVTARLGVPAFLAQKYAGVAKDYGEERVARCWMALAATEDAYRSGTIAGAAEVLVVSWLGITRSWQVPGIT